MKPFFYFGANEFSVLVLRELCRANLLPSLIITLPDKPVGRKKILTPPPLKLGAEKLKLRFDQPTTLKNNPKLIELITELKPTFGIVAAYGKLIPKTILELFPAGLLNLHPSLLPRYRGPSPIQTALLNGEEKTGVSIMLLDEELDHGPVLAQQEITILPDETYPELFLKLALQGAKTLIETLPLWLEGKITPQPQNHQLASYTKLLTWQDGKINPDKPVNEVYNQIRALNPEPGTWLEMKINNQSRIIKILRAKRVSLPPSFTFNHYGLIQSNKDLLLLCQGGALLVEQIQPAGKRPLTGQEFLNGYGKWLERIKT